MHSILSSMTYMSVASVDSFLVLGISNKISSKPGRIHKK